MNISLLDVMFVWTPNRDIWVGSRLAGRIEATTIPEPAEYKEHPMSFGACHFPWRDTTDAQRHALVQKLIRRWLYEDNMSEAAVREAITRVAEFSDFPFSVSRE